MNNTRLSMTKANKTRFSIIKGGELISIDIAQEHNQINYSSENTIVMHSAITIPTTESVSDILSYYILAKA